MSDVNPRKGESKEDFISRFMSETKSEYPDEKQRLAVAYSYWNKRKTRDISRANEAFATREIKRLEQKIRDIEFELRALQKEDLRYGSAKSTDRRQALLKTQLKEAQNKLADYKRRFPECCDSLKRFEIEFTDSKGRNVIRIVRAKSIEEVFDKYYNG